jgi:hypothetical protein
MIVFLLGGVTDEDFKTEVMASRNEHHDDDVGRREQNAWLREQGVPSACPLLDLFEQADWCSTAAAHVVQCGTTSNEETPLHRPGGEKLYCGAEIPLCGSCTCMV